jgi:hypothetical protein
MAIKPKAKGNNRTTASCYFASYKEKENSTNDPTDYTASYPRKLYSTYTIFLKIENCVYILKPSSYPHSKESAHSVPHRNGVGTRVTGDS